MQQLWHYQSEEDGRRLGPVPVTDIAAMIAGNRFSRSTLVWNSTMSDWASASKTELLALFGDAPPPAHRLRSWPVYAFVATPVWGSLLIYLYCSAFAASTGMTPLAMYGSLNWVFFFAVAFIPFGELDATYLERAGLKIEWELAFVALFPPVYLTVRGAKLRKLYRFGHFKAYAPLYVLAVMLTVYAYTAPIYFGTNAVALANG